MIQLVGGRNDRNAPRQLAVVVTMKFIAVAEARLLEIVVGRSRDSHQEPHRQGHLPLAEIPTAEIGLGDSDQGWIAHRVIVPKGGESVVPIRPRQGPCRLQRV